MRCRQKRAKPGDVFPVTDSYHYPLPPGLKAGTLVKLVEFGHGYWTVEARWPDIPKCLHGPYRFWLAYELNGPWLDENDPQVIAERERSSLRFLASSCANGGRVNPPLLVPVA